MNLIILVYELNAIVGEVVSGYIVVVDGESYDLTKQGVIDYINDTDISIISSNNSFASNLNGG